MECLAHVGQEEAVLRPAFDAQGKRAAYEEAVLVGVAQSQLGLSCQVYALEGASLYLFLVKVQHTCHFPVIFDLCVVFAHSFVASYRKFKCFSAKNAVWSPISFSASALFARFVVTLDSGERKGAFLGIRQSTLSFV